MSGTTNPPIEHFEHHFLLVTITEDNNVKVETYFINEGNSEEAQEYDFVMPTIQDMSLQNYNINSGENRIFASQNTIELAGGGTEFIAEEGSSVEVVAGESIVLGDGFHASGNFHAYIQELDCENIEANSAKSSNKTINTDSLEINNVMNEDIIIKRGQAIFLGRK